MAQGLERTDASSYTIEELLALVEKGSIRIPHFQRGQRWGPGDAAKLFDSIYKAYPIGTILLWKRPAPQVPGRTDTLWVVVDGQQRLTALARVLLPVNPRLPAPRGLYFDLAKERFVWRRPSEPSDTHLPVREAYKLPKVMAWLRERDLDGPLQDRAFKLADRLRNYRVPSYAVEMEREGDMAPLREIFDRINTFGKRMNRAEVFHALTSLSTPGGRDLSSLAYDVGSWGYGAVDDSTLMLCVLSVRGPDVLRDFRSEFADDPSQLPETIDLAEAALRQAIAFLRDDAGVPHLGLVPYQHLLVALVRLFVFHENPSEWERVLLRRWFWRAAMHGPLPKLGSTGTLRLFLNTIDGCSVYDTLAELLEALPTERRKANVGRFQWNWADSKATLCAMARLGPLIPTGAAGEVFEIEVTRVLTTDRQAALQRVFPAVRGELARSLANRIFWQPPTDSAGSADREDLLENEEDLDRPDAEGADPAILLATAGPKVLESHAISRAAAEALRRGDSEAFLRTRRRDIQRIVEDFVDARAEWDHATRPALASV